LGIALLNKLKMCPFKTCMMAGVQDVIAIVCRVVGDVLQIRVRRITGEQAIPLSAYRFDNQACIMKLTSVTVCCA